MAAVLALTQILAFLCFIDIMKSELLKNIPLVYLNSIHVQQDGAPAHRAQMVSLF